MKISISVKGSNGQEVSSIVVVQQEGDLSSAVGRAIADYKSQFPKALPFDYTVRIAQD